jgi:hypothetical protein
MAMDFPRDCAGDRLYYQLLSHFVDSLMKPGNLVRITRNAIGVRAGTIALVMRKAKKRGNGDYEIWEVQLMNGKSRRYMGMDLVVV